MKPKAYRAGVSTPKAGVPVELGVKVCILEDQYQFILHHKVMEQLTDDQVPAVERQCERYLQAPAASPGLSAAQRLEIFARAVEPALQRELTTKGAASGDGSYAAELIGYVEIVSQIGL